MLRLTLRGNNTLRGSLALGFGKTPEAIMDVPPQNARDGEPPEGAQRPDGADAIIACSGLCVCGIVLPSGALLNRVLTRSPYYYNPELLSHFVDGLSAARSRAAFLSFYQVLEHEAGGQRASGGDMASLTRLLQDMDIYPDRALLQIVNRVTEVDGGAGLVGQIRTSKGKFRRDVIARLLHTETRNPLIHTRIGETISRDDLKPEAGTVRPAAIPPFSRDEQESAIEARTVLCRELARVVVGQSGELRAR
jgi:hypothetical protein